MVNNKPLFSKVNGLYSNVHSPKIITISEKNMLNIPTIKCTGLMMYNSNCMSIKLFTCITLCNLQCIPFSASFYFRIYLQNINYIYLDCKHILYRYVVFGIPNTSESYQNNYV